MLHELWAYMCRNMVKARLTSLVRQQFLHRLLHENVVAARGASVLAFVSDEAALKD